MYSDVLAALVCMLVVVYTIIKVEEVLVVGLVVVAEREEENVLVVGDFEFEFDLYLVETLTTTQWVE